MKRLLFILSVTVLCVSGAQAQEWWQGTSSPAPKEPVGKDMGLSPVWGEGQGSYRRLADDTPSRPEPREDQPKPASRAELKRQKAAFEQKQAHTLRIKEELARLSRSFQKQPAKPTIELTPGDAVIFEITPDDDKAKRTFGPIMVSSLSGVRTPASRIPLENLRRVAAILAAFRPAISSGMSEEDMSFMAGEAARALEGAALSVEIGELPVGREDDTRRLAQQAQDIETLRAAAQSATAVRLQVEEQLVKVQRDLRSGKGDKEALKNQQEKLLQSYKAAYNIEANRKAEVKDRMTEVWHEATASPRR